MEQIRGLAVKVNNWYEYHNVISLCESGEQTSKEVIFKTEPLNDIVFDNGENLLFMHNWIHGGKTMPAISYDEFIKEYTNENIS